MFDQVTQDLKRWLAGLADSPDVTFQLPSGNQATPSISLYFIDVRQKPAKPGATRSTQRFQLRYLVIASASDPLGAQRLLGSVLAAAVEREDVEIDTESPSAALWSALGVRPQPSFLLSVSWDYEADPVRPRFAARSSERGTHRLRRLTGKVLGRNDVPITFAAVELPALGRLAMTDHDGRFDLSVVPRSVDLMLRVTTKGRVIESRVDDGADTGQDLLVRVAL